MARLSKVPLTLWLIAGVLDVLENGRAQGKVIDDGPQHLGDVSSIGESLLHAGQRPLHILYVHGIGATGAGDSQKFQQGICARLKGCKITAVPVPVGREYADRGEFENGAEPPAFEYMQGRAWMSKREWAASAPFVDHYVLRRSDGGPVVVDEINWWPLVFPLKCRGIMAGEARLAGPGASFLDVCSQPEEEDPPHPGRFKHYTWISPEQAKMLKSIRPKGALLNRSLKNGILDWGFSDALMAAGSMRSLFREGMRQLFVKSARFSADGSENEWQRQMKDSDGMEREFVVVSHSLGSYLVFSTLNLDQEGAVPENASAQPQSDAAKEDSAARYILARTSLVYFFANQIPLLELANIGEPQPEGMAQRVALSAQIMKWKDLRNTVGQGRGGAGVSAVKPPQLIVWSGPSDLLSWRVPGMNGLVIANLYVRNTWWHWLLANPGSAHGKYAGNKNVLRVMMRPRAAPD
jgi:hypothetical protein